jgi:spermidine/putrescine transport system ATP-binding protein
VPGRILNRIYLGDQTEFSIASEGLGEVLVRAFKTSEVFASGLRPGDAVVIGWRQQAGLALADS